MLAAGMLKVLCNSSSMSLEARYNVAMCHLHRKDQEASHFSVISQLESFEKPGLLGMPASHRGFLTGQWQMLGIKRYYSSPCTLLHGFLSGVRGGVCICSNSDVCYFMGFLERIQIWDPR